MLAPTAHRSASTKPRLCGTLQRPTTDYQPTSAVRRRSRATSGTAHSQTPRCVTKKQWPNASTCALSLQPHCRPQSTSAAARPPAPERGVMYSRVSTSAREPHQHAPLLPTRSHRSAAPDAATSKYRSVITEQRHGEHGREQGPGAPGAAAPLQTVEDAQVLSQVLRGVMVIAAKTCQLGRSIEYPTANRSATTLCMLYRSTINRWQLNEAAAPPAARRSQKRRDA